MLVIFLGIVVFFGRGEPCNYTDLDHENKWVEANVGCLFAHRRQWLRHSDEVRYYYQITKLRALDCYANGP